MPKDTAFLPRWSRASHHTQNSCHLASHTHFSPPEGFFNEINYKLWSSFCLKVPRFHSDSVPNARTMAPNELRPVWKGLNEMLVFLRPKEAWQEVRISLSPPEVGGPLKPQPRDMVSGSFVSKPEQVEGHHEIREGSVWPINPRAGEKTVDKFADSFSMTYAMKQNALHS